MYNLVLFQDDEFACQFGSKSLLVKVAGLILTRTISVVAAIFSVR